MFLINAELIAWSAYFSVGILLLVLLVFTRHALRKMEARKQETNKAMQRFHLGNKVTDPWKAASRDRYVK